MRSRLKRRGDDRVVVVEGDSDSQTLHDRGWRKEGAIGFEEEGDRSFRGRAIGFEEEGDRGWGREEAIGVRGRLYEQREKRSCAGCNAIAILEGGTIGFWLLRGDSASQTLRDRGWRREGAIELWLLGAIVVLEEGAIGRVRWEGRSGYRLLIRSRWGWHGRGDRF